MLDLGHTRLDVGRSARTGIPEAVFAAGKTPQQCHDIVARLLTDSEDPVVVTRCAAEHRARLLEFDPTGDAGATLTWQHRDPTLGSAVVVSGGTSDAPVVEECALTLAALGASVTTITDVGVAGLQRLTDAVPDIDGADVVITVAGMEAALPTVLAGLIAAPIISVPTSVGYGTTFDGLTALLSMMSSCAPGIAVVGIDNGYGAACAAHRILAGTR